MYFSSERDDRMNFDLVAEAYDIGRPEYPSVIYEEIFHRLQPRPVVLEIGSGSGQATGELAKRSASLECVEPGENFVRQLRERFSEQRHVAIHQVDFEDYRCTHQFDLVFSGCALHWVPKEVALSRIRNLLSVHGWLVGVWNQIGLAPELAEIVEAELRPSLPDFELPFYEPETHEKYFAEGVEDLCTSWGFHNCQMDVVKGIRNVDIATFMAFLQSYANVKDRSASEVKTLLGRVAEAIRTAGLDAIEIIDYFPIAMAQMES